jgi:hypothetical protein
LKAKSLISADIKRKNALARKSGLLLGAALAAAVLVSGCSDGSSDSSPEPAAKGVLGQISGVVVDASTGLPLSGVTVEVAGKKAVTDDTGYYLLDDVIPNSENAVYVVSYYKSGYAAQQVSGVNVNAGEYKTQDPFYEKQVIDNLTTLFETWLNNTHPNIAGNSSLNTWTYTNGVYINGEGSTVQVTESADGTPNFELVKKLNYTYKFGQSLPTANLQPLTAALKGKIFLYTDSIDAAVTLTQAGLKIQFEYNDAYYGTGETKDDGTFEVTGLPAYANNLKLVITGFVEGEAYYDGKAPQVYDGNKFNSEAVSATFSTKKDPSDTWNIYFKGKTDAAYIVNVSTGEAGAPLPPASKITVEFSKAIDTKTFTANINNLKHTVTKGVKEIIDEGYANDREDLSFDVSWDADKKKATLTPRNKLSSYAAGGVLPYSVDSAISIGELEIYAKAADGSGVLDPENPTKAVTETATPWYPTPIDGPARFKVYTEEGLKLLKAEVIQAAGNAARAVLPIGGALKLTFNKAIAPLVGGTEFKFAFSEDTPFSFTEVKAAYKVDATDKKIVYVYADKPIGADTTLSYTVYAEDDTFNDKTTGLDVPVAGISGDSDADSIFVQNPYLGKTTKQDEYNTKQIFTNVVIGDANAGWDRAEKIKIELMKTVTGVTDASWYYKTGTAYRAVSDKNESTSTTTSTITPVTSNDKELTIALPDKLAGGGTFYPAFVFEVDSETYTIGPKARYPNADAEVQITLAADTTADLDTEGIFITSAQAPIFGVTSAAAINATAKAFTATYAAEDFDTRTLVGYIKSKSNPVWTALPTSANISLPPSIVSEKDIGVVPAFSLGSIPAYKGNEVEVKWRGVSSDGCIIETPARRIIFVEAMPSITWSDSFREEDTGGGVIAQNQVTAVLSEWKFDAADRKLVKDTDYEIGNLPLGLTLELTISHDRTTVNIKLSGIVPPPHGAANSINNLTITFKAPAFEQVNAAGYTANDGTSINPEAIHNYTKNDIRITLIDDQI